MPVTSETRFDFGRDFANYGDDEENIEREVKKDILRTIGTSISSRFFDRSEGAGIETLENEILNPINLAMLKFQIVQGILKYNKDVAEDRQVIVSQEMVDITQNVNESELIIKVYYFMANDVHTAGTAPQEIAAAVAVG